MLVQVCPAMKQEPVGRERLVHISSLTILNMSTNRKPEIAHSVRVANETLDELPLVFEDQWKFLQKGYTSRILTESCTRWCFYLSDERSLRFGTSVETSYKMWICFKMLQIRQYQAGHSRKNMFGLNLVLANNINLWKNLFTTCFYILIDTKNLRTVNQKNTNSCSTKTLQGHGAATVPRKVPPHQFKKLRRARQVSWVLHKAFPKKTFTKGIWWNHKNCLMQIPELFLQRLALQKRSSQVNLLQDCVWKYTAQQLSSPDTQR